jgi:hypothetical protein
LDNKSVVNSSALSRTSNSYWKGRNTYFVIINIRDDNQRFLLLGELYKSVVIPSVINGYEVWNDLKNKDLLLLNRLQHFVAQ